MKRSILSWLIIVVSIAASIVVYPDMPELMPIHWDINHEANDQASKAFALFLLPGIMTLLTMILPRKQNDQKLKSSILIVQNVLMLGLLVLHGLIIASGYGLNVDMSKIVLPMVGILFITTANYMSRIPPNSDIGIKTMHTLSNDTVWIKTHKAAARIAGICGLLMIGTAFIPSPYQMILFLTIVVVPVLSSVYLSYYFSKQEN